ncbi:3-hydroxyacyl-CoA dehydrogenase [Acidocella sp.]|uniref:3-hydroxyacyl-CoA dehydrogenase n=1 Tax=Acidocella sp. TaxID=50710 RepID=UPI003CFF3A6E
MNASATGDDKVAIVGTGLVGSGWAIVFARAGYKVALYDTAPGNADKSLAWIAERLRDLEAAGLIEAPDAIQARLSIAPSLSDALNDALYVQESVLERVEVKTTLMSEIDKVIGPRTLVGSSSSGLGASLYTEHVTCRERCLVAHPLNPPYLAPIVELVPAPWTTQETMQAVRALMLRVGQSPVEMTREIEGFILNRLQGVLLMEAWRLVEAGLATAQDVDKTISEGLGLRWAFMGPFETIDLNASGGVADYARRLGGLYHNIASATKEHRPWDETLIAKVEAQRRTVLPADQLAARAAWRDRRLMALAKHKRDMDLAEKECSNSNIK